MHPTHRLAGVVRRADGSGVAGLDVHVIDSDHQFDDDLGRSRTDTEGRFAITFSRADYADQEPHEREPEPYVRLRDRTGRIVHTDDSARPFPPEEEFVIELDEAALDRHDAEPLVWEVPETPVDLEARTELIESVIAAHVAPRGSTEFTAFRNAALCPGPDIFTHPDLLERALGALQGFPDDRRRFREILEDLAAARPPVPEDDFLTPEWTERTRRGMVERRLAYELAGGTDERLPRAPIDRDLDLLPADVEPFPTDDRLFAEDSLSYDYARLADDDRVRDAFDRVREGVETDLRTREPALAPDAAALLLEGALAVAPDREAQRRYAATVLDQFRGAVLFARTYETALAVRRGTATPTALRTQIRRGAVECGPDDGPIPDPIRGPGDIERYGDLLRREFWYLRCLMRGESSFRSPSSRERYTITAVSPPSACGGDTVTITGRNFGTEPGRVEFATPSGPVTVAAESWSDTEIVVTVPSDATAGSLHLRIPRGPVNICGKFVVLFKYPTDDSIGTFAGGPPGVSLYADSGCHAPGDEVYVSWTVRPATATDLELAIDGVGTFTDIGHVESRQVTIPTSIDQPRTLTVRVTATTACGTTTTTDTIEVDVAPELTVAGMEVTQGIQRFALGGTNNNSLDTIAGKDTIVRVFVRADRDGFAGDEAPGVTGDLDVDGVTLQPMNGSVPTSATARTAPTMSITAVGAPDPTVTDHSLNFRVPAGLATGTKRLRARVFAPETCGEVPFDTQSMDWTWREERALPVRYVRIRDDAPGNGTGQRPTRAQSLFTVRRAFDLLPSPPTDIAPAWDDTLETTRDFGDSTTADGDPNEHAQLLDDLDGFRTRGVLAEWVDERAGPFDFGPLFEAAAQYWVGLTVRFNRGRAYRPGNASLSCIYRVSDGDAITTNLTNPDTRRVKTAHELGHNLDNTHITLSCPGLTAPGCPDSGCYAHPTAGVLQGNEVAFDPFWNTVLLDDANAPTTISDTMSYGCTRWTSPDLWTNLRTQI